MADKYSVDSPGASSDNVGSKDNIVGGKKMESCQFDKKDVGYFVLVVCILVAAAVAGVVSSMYTIANLQTYNLHVNHSHINMANVLVSRDKLLIYLPAHHNQTFVETQTIFDHSSKYMAFVNRPESVCFIMKMTVQPTVTEVMKVLEGKKDLVLKSLDADKNWESRRLNEAELGEIGSFIWESCSAKELLMMIRLGTGSARNDMKCMSFCLPHYTVNANTNVLEVDKLDCVPAKCINRF